VNPALAAWNSAENQLALETMLACCGAKRWAAEMVAARPIARTNELSRVADLVWSTMRESDWLEAFACHPRIGERKETRATGQSAAWSKQEQSKTNTASENVLAQLAAGNRQYEDRFGFTYIVCATGKSADEMLAILTRRLGSVRDAELREAAEQQRQIMQIRLRKWLME